MDLLEEAKKGNKNAYKELIAPIRIKLYKTARLYFKQEPEVLNAVNYTIKNLYKEIRNVQNGENLMFWAVAILIKYCNQKNIEYSKSEKWKKKYDTEEYELDYQLYRRESLVEQLITSINPDRRLFSILYYYDGLSISSISKLMKKPVNYLNNLLGLTRNDFIELIINEGVKKYNDYV